jgi:hypothetical protein
MKELVIPIEAEPEVLDLMQDPAYFAMCNTNGQS